MRALALIVLSLLMTGAYAGERLVGSNVDVRTVIAFKVSDAAVQRLAPEGWEVSPPPAGPLKGFNLVLVLIDSSSSSDSAGKPVEPFRGAVLAIPARRIGTNVTVTMVSYGIAGRDGSPGAYGVYAPGKVAIERKVGSGPDQKPLADETWVVSAEDGNAIDARIQYERGPTTQSKLEQKTYSGAKPEFFRIYRVEQVADLVRSTAAGVDRVTSFSFRASGSRLASLFDGTEQLIGLISVPSYSRTVFLPD